MKHLLRISLVFTLLLPSLLQAQESDSVRIPVDSTLIDTVIIDEELDAGELIEDFISNAEVDDEVDYTIITDYLQELREKPLNLNNARYEDLIRLPGMNDILVNNLRRYIRTIGKLKSIYEIQAVPGYRLDIIQQIIPYVTVRQAAAQDIGPSSRHPRGPTIKELFNNMNGEIIHRTVFVVEDQAGYTREDSVFSPVLDEDGNQTGTDTTISNPFAGNKYRQYSRIRIRSGKNFSFALTGEKDSGEEFRWDPQNQFYGYDFLSGHLAISNFGNLKSFVIGDYNMAFGQGLVLSRGLGFGKGAETISTTKMPTYGIKPYASVNENLLQRGAAATLAFGDVFVTGFYSNINLDASTQEGDTLFGDFPIISALQTSGLHRTASELANRRSITETMYGGRVAYNSPTLRIGTTHYLQEFDNPLSRPLNEYNQFDFRGDQNYVNGLDFDWVFRNFNFFGEIARSKSGGWGMIGGLMGSISATTDVAIVVRNFDRDFHSPKGYVFAERPTALRNERGVYLGIKVKPNPKWTITGYFDQYFFPWNRFGASFPSRGWEFLTQTTYRIRRGTEVYVRFRTDQRQKNSSDFPDGQKLRFLIPTERHQFRVDFRTKIDRNLQTKTRAEFSWYREDRGAYDNGFLVYQDLIWKWGFKFKVTARYAMFDAQNFNTRIYAYENDILGFFSIPPYFRTGSRYYLILNYKPLRKLEFWLRVAQTRLHQENEFGSGLSRIDGDTQTEIKAQVRLKF